REDGEVDPGEGDVVERDADAAARGGGEELEALLVGQAALGHLENELLVDVEQAGAAADVFQRPAAEDLRRHVDAEMKIDMLAKVVAQLAGDRLDHPVGEQPGDGGLLD